MGGGVWWAVVHGVVKSRTRLSDFTFTFHFHALEKEMATHSSLVGCRLWGRTESDTTLNDPMDYSPPGSSAYGIFQARVLEWGAIAFSNKLTVNDPTFEVRKHRENSGKKS